MTFFDNNQNGIRDTGEVDYRREFVTASGPISVTLRSYGLYGFALPFGTYQITCPVTPPWIQTSSPLSYSVTVDSANPAISSVNFGLFRDFKLVAGTVFNDVNRDSLYDPGDTPMENWSVYLRKSSGGSYGSKYTDNSGRFHFLLFDTGAYSLREDPWGWISTLPGGTAPEYSFVVPVLDGSTSEFLFGNIPPPPVARGTIRGTVFNDLNRNGIQDEHEPMLSGQAVAIGDTLYPPEYRTVTDSAGRYSFDSIYAGTHYVHLLLDTGWVKSFPSTPYSILLNPGETRDSINFAVYLMRTGSIGGVLFDELNGDGIRDAGEAPLNNWPVQLNGSVQLSGTTDDTGAYRFDSLWAGVYKITTGLRNHWKQTFPSSLQPHFVILGNETDLVGVDFGIRFDTTFNLSFRTFVAESLALSKDLRGKFGPVPVKDQLCDFRFSIVNTGSEPATQISFKLHVSSRNVNIAPGNWSIDSKGSIATVTFSPSLLPDDSVVISGIGKKASRQAIGGVRFTYESGSTSKSATVREVKNELLYAMPNALNALVAGAGKGLRVGVGGPHSVVHPTYKEVMKSLWDSHKGPVVGPPRCLDRKSVV
jgi:hypothetical protein